MQRSIIVSTWMHDCRRVLQWHVVGTQKLPRPCEQDVASYVREQSAGTDQSRMEIRQEKMQHLWGPRGG